MRVFPRLCWLIALALPGCGEMGPTDGFLLGGVTIAGVVSRDGVPVSGVGVRIYGFLSCEPEPGLLKPKNITDQNGRYAEALVSPFAQQFDACLVVRAYFESAGIPDSLTLRNIWVTFRPIPSADAPSDTAWVNIALPP